MNSGLTLHLNKPCTGPQCPVRLSAQPERAGGAACAPTATCGAKRDNCSCGKTMLRSARPSPVDRPHDEGLMARGGGPQLLNDPPPSQWASPRLLYNAMVVSKHSNHSLGFLNGCIAGVFTLQSECQFLFSTWSLGLFAGRAPSVVTSKASTLWTPFFDMQISAKRSSPMGPCFPPCTPTFQSTSV